MFERISQPFVLIAVLLFMKLLKNFECCQTWQLAMEYCFYKLKPACHRATYLPTLNARVNLVVAIDAVSKTIALFWALYF